jgi:predicted ferric reductase
VTQQLWWYAVRASGVVAWVLVTASVVWGLLLASRSTTRPRPAWVLDLHRFLGALTLVFLAVHLVGLLFDKWVGFGPRELFVPMASEYRPGALTWGIVALYLLVVVEVSSRLMRWIPRRAWHAIHCSSFAMFAMTTTHVLTAGTDARRLPTIVFAWVSSLLVVGLLSFRVVARVLAARRRTALRRRLESHERLPGRSLEPVDDAIGDLVRRRDPAARHGHHRTGAPRSTPR